MHETLRVTSISSRVALAESGERRLKFISALKSRVLLVRYSWRSDQFVIYFSVKQTKHFPHSYTLNPYIWWNLRHFEGRKKGLSYIRRKFVDRRYSWHFEKKNASLFNIRLPQRRHQMPRAFPRRSEIPRDPGAAYKSSLQHRGPRIKTLLNGARINHRREEVGEVLPQNRLKIMHNTRRHVARKNANWWLRGRFINLRCDANAISGRACGLSLAGRSS